MPRLVQVGASAVRMTAPGPMRGVTGNGPLAEPRWASYIASKARAQRLVLAADASSLRTSVILPPLI